MPGGVCISCTRRAISADEFARHRQAHRAGVEWLDAAQIRGPLVCRPLRADDMFWPLGAACRRGAAEFLKKQSLPAHERGQAFCVCDDLGIVYVSPLRIDARVRVTPATTEIIELGLARS